MMLAESNSGRAELAAAASEDARSSSTPSRRHKKKDDADQPVLSFVDVHRAQAMRVIAMLSASSQPRLAIDAPDTLQGRKVYYVYHMERAVCVLAVVCDSLCSNATTTTFTERRQAAFAFVDRVHATFCATYSAEQVEEAGSPYAFLDFEATIQKLLSPQAISYSQQSSQPVTAASTMLQQSNNYNTNSAYSRSTGMPASVMPVASDSSSGSSSVLLEKVNSELRDARRVVADSIQDMLERGDKITTVSNRSRDLMEETSKYHHRARDFERQLWWQQKLPVITVAGVVILFVILRIFVF